MIYEEGPSNITAQETGLWNISNVFHDQYCATRLKSLLKFPSGPRHAFSWTRYTEEPSFVTPCVSLVPSQRGLRISPLFLKSLNLAERKLALSAAADCCVCCCLVHTVNRVGKCPCDTCRYIYGLWDWCDVPRNGNTEGVCAVYEELETQCHFDSCSHNGCFKWNFYVAASRAKIIGWLVDY